jgi:uncharacterized protein YdeI (BOF family)
VRVWRLLCVLCLLLPACESRGVGTLDLDRIRVTTDARLRTDTVGERGARATFVLVDAENTASDGASVTLAGELFDAGGARVGELRAQSMWMPAGASRTFALVAHEGELPTATAARVHVRGALVPPAPPPAHVDDRRELVDDGKVVVQGVLHNDAERGGSIIVIASFHDDGGRPMTRPFSVVFVPPHDQRPMQFVGPPGSKHGDMYVGDMTY